MATGAVGAASAVAGAGRALMPLIDKLANTMIGDNPVLLDDLRWGRGEWGARVGWRVLGWLVADQIRGMIC